VGIAGDEIEGGGKLPHSEAPSGRGIPSNDPLSPVVVTICQTQFQSKDSSHPPECDNIPHKPPQYLIEPVKPGIQPVSTGLQLFPAHQRRLKHHVPEIITAPVPVDDAARPLHIRK